MSDPADLARLAAGWPGLRPFYETNDDTGMRQIAEGAFVPGVPPDGHVLFMHGLLGRLLAALYERAPTWPWYDLLLTTGLVLGLAFTAGVLFRRAGPGPGRLLAAAFVVVFGVGNLVIFQFTRVAGLLAVAGSLLLLDTALAPGTRPAARAARWGIGAALLVLGSMVRAEPALLVLGLAVPLGVGAFLVQPERPRRRRPWLAVGAVLVAVGVAMLGVRVLDERWYAASPAWRDYRIHNWIRSELTELRGQNPGAREAILGGAGWSRNDLAMLDGWFYASPAVFGLERMRSARAALGARPMTSRNVGPRRLVRATEQAMAGGRPAILFTAGLVLLVWGWRARAFVASCLVGAVGGLILIALLFKAPPPRLAWTVWTLQAAVAVRVVAPGGVRNGIRLAVGGVLLLAAAAASLGPVWLEARYRHTTIARIAADLARWNPASARLHVSVGGAFPDDLIMRPFQARPVIPGLQVLPIGGAAYTPLVQGFLQREGIDDLALALCTRPALRLLVSTTLLDPIARYMEEHHRLPVRIVPDFQGQAIVTYQCQPAGGGGPVSAPGGPPAPSTGRPPS